MTTRKIKLEALRTLLRDAYLEIVGLRLRHRDHSLGRCQHGVAWQVNRSVGSPPYQQIIEEQMICKSARDVQNMHGPPGAEVCQIWCPQWPQKRAAPQHWQKWASGSFPPGLIRIRGC